MPRTSPRTKKRCTILYRIQIKKLSRIKKMNSKTYLTVLEVCSRKISGLSLKKRGGVKKHREDQRSLFMSFKRPLSMTLKVGDLKGFHSTTSSQVGFGSRMTLNFTSLRGSFVQLSAKVSRTIQTQR